MPGPHLFFFLVYRWFLQFVFAQGKAIVKGGDPWKKEMKIRSIYYSSAFIGWYQYEVVRRTGLNGSSGCATLTFGTTRQRFYL
jgi:hypothetical protein